MIHFIFKSFSLLSFKEKNKFYILSVLTLFAFVLETISIGSIIPMLVFLTDSQSNIKFEFLNNIKLMSDFTEIQKINFFVFIFFFFFLIKNIYLIFFNWYSHKFSAQLTLSIAGKLFTKYLNESYLFFVKKNSATLIRNIMRETERFSNNVIVINANLILEILVVLSVSLILFFYDPKSFAFIVTISFFSFLILSILTRKKLSLWSRDRSKYEAKVINRLQNSFSLYKVIKMFFIDSIS